MNKKEKFIIDYQSLLNQVVEVVFITDKDGNVIYGNDAWSKLFPVKNNKIVGFPFSEIVSEQDKEKITTIITGVLSEGKKIIAETVCLRFDENTDLTFDVDFSPVTAPASSEVIGTMGMLRQGGAVSANEIQELRGLNEEFMQNAPYGISTLDINGIMLNENPALRLIMGRSDAESLIGVNLLQQKKFIDAELDTYFKKAIADKKTITVKNVQYLTISSKKELILNITFTPIFGNQNKIDKVLVIVEDNTEQSKISDRIYRADKLSALGFLASGVAKELRNHANKMVMDLNFVKNNIAEHSPATDYIESLVFELARIKSISDQLLSLSTTDEDEKEECDLGNIFNEHPIDVAITRLKSDGFNITFDIETGEHLVVATKNQLHQIIGQFLENSEEAMPEKGDINISIKNVESEEGRFVVMTVKDNGVGISEDNIQKIFQPFFTTKGKSATGLGLMIVSAIVENLHGAVAVKSSPGEGTSIRIALPQVG